MTSRTADAWTVIRAGPTTLHGVSPDEERLTLVYAAYAPRVWAYARRHAQEHECDDVVAETFAIAWRKIDRVPEQPLPWLLVVARNVLANRRRTADRADRVWFEAVRTLWAPIASPEHDVAERDAMLRALRTCTRVEREALLLVAWEGLTPTQAAAVAGCSARAFTVRLHRARQRISSAVQAERGAQAAVSPFGRAGPAEGRPASARSTSIMPPPRGTPVGAGVPEGPQR